MSQSQFIRQSTLTATTLLGLAFSGAAAADPHFGYGGIGYDNLSFDDNDIGISWIGGGFESTYDRLTFGLEGYIDRYELDGYKEKSEYGAAYLGFDITEDFTVTAGAAAMDLLGLSDETNEAYVLGAEYAYNYYTFGIANIWTEIVDEDTEALIAFADYDNRIYSAYLQVMSVEDYEFYFIGTEYDNYVIDAQLDIAYQDDLDIQTAVLSGSYQFADNFRASGSLGVYSVEDLDLTEASIGAGYRLFGETWIDAGYTYGAESGDKLYDALSIAVTFEFGDRRNKVVESIVRTGYALSF